MSFKYIYHSKKKNKYYYLGIQPCDKCHNLIDKLMWIEYIYTKKTKAVRYFCKNCVMQRQKLPCRWDEIKNVIVSYTLPPDAFPVFDAPPSLTNFSGEDNFFMASHNRDGEKVLDRAIQTHNPNFMKMEGVNSEEHLIEDVNRKDAKYTLKNIHSAMRTYRDANLLTSKDEEERKRLGIR